jgi:hypothetical protein
MDMNAAYQEVGGIRAAATICGTNDKAVRRAGCQEPSASRPAGGLAVTRFHSGYMVTRSPYLSRWILTVRGLRPLPSRTSPRSGRTSRSGHEHAVVENAVDQVGEDGVVPPEGLHALGQRRLRAPRPGVNGEIHEGKRIHGNGLRDTKSGSIWPCSKAGTSHGYLYPGRRPRRR